MLRGIEAVAVAKGYQVLLGDTGNDAEREKGVFKHPEAKKKQMEWFYQLTGWMQQPLKR